MPARSPAFTIQQLHLITDNFSGKTPVAVRDKLIPYGHFPAMGLLTVRIVPSVLETGKQLLLRPLRRYGATSRPRALKPRSGRGSGPRPGRGFNATRPKRFLG